MVNENQYLVHNILLNIIMLSIQKLLNKYYIKWL